MIYLKNTVDRQEVSLPLVVAGIPARLVLTSGIDHRAYELAAEVLKENTLGWVLAVSLPETRKAWEIPDGEWDYRLKDGDGRTLGTGVAVVGDYNADRWVNEDNEIIYKQYGND